ncbi:transcriptional regulator [Citricoccus parietis]|uniref:Transcriptional regulator n=1 Tax=Citricoccus parietis TaxID=592307 RepID=A0ABV5G473_9MICC
MQEFTGLNTPDISRAVSHLADRHLVRVRKELKGRYPLTVVQATDEGRKRFKGLLTSLKKYGVDG